MDAQQERSTARGVEDRGVEVRAFRPAWLHVDDLPLIGWTGLWGWMATVLALGIVLAPTPPQPGWESLAQRPEVMWLPAPTDDPPVEDVAAPAPVPAGPPEPVQQEVDRVVTTPDPEPLDRRQMALEMRSIRERMTRRLLRGGASDLQADTELLASSALGPRDEGDVQGLRSFAPTADPRMTPGLGTFVWGPSAGGIDEIPVDLPDTPTAVAEIEPVEQGAEVSRNQPPKTLMGRFRYCYEDRLRSTQISGRVRIALRVASGRVVEVDVLEDSLNDAAVVDCMERKAMSWRPLREPDGQMGPWTLIFRPR